MIPRLLAAALLLLLAGCATPGQHARAFWGEREPAAVELDTVPFHPQRAYQCGPAALATVLGASGVAVTPDELTGEVFLPARRGSLQTEMAASVRRRGRLAYVLLSRASAVLEEVASGRPVLVLQNLGLRMLPRWHYAVVVGYDATRDVLMLQSGTRRRVVLPRARFQGTWSRAGQWAMVVARPAEIPASAEPAGYASAVAEFEAVGATGAGALGTAYEAGLRRWPREPLLLFGLANQQAARGDRDGAEALLRRLLDIEPAHVPARNNLAVILLRTGRVEEAASLAGQALSDARGTPWEPAVSDTLEEIRAARASAAPSPH